MNPLFLFVQVMSFFMAIDTSGFYMVPDDDRHFKIYFFPMAELLDLSLESWEGTTHIYAKYNLGMMCD